MLADYNDPVCVCCLCVLACGLQRLMEMKAMTSERTRGDRQKRGQKQADKELAKLNQQ